MSAISLNGPRKIYPKADGTGLKFCFKNETGEDLYDLRIVTGYDSIFGFTPEIQKIEITQGADQEEIEFVDGLEPGDESDNVVVHFIDEIEAGATFCVSIDFDEDFDDDEWVRFSPSDDNDRIILTEESVQRSAQLALNEQQAGIVPQRGGLIRDSAAEKRIVARALFRMGAKQALGAIETVRRSRT